MLTPSAVLAYWMRGSIRLPFSSAPAPKARRFAGYRPPPKGTAALQSGPPPPFCTHAGTLTRHHELGLRLPRARRAGTEARWLLALAARRLFRLGPPGGDPLLPAGPAVTAD